MVPFLAAGAAPARQGIPRLKMPLALALGVGVSLIVGVAHARQDDSVMWDASHRFATFVGGPVLTMVENESEDDIPRNSPLRLGDAQAAKRGLESLRKETLTGLSAHPGLDRYCPRQIEGINLKRKPAPKSVTLVGLIRSGDIAVVGTVERAVPGLYLASGELATHTFLRIDEVLRDATRSVRPGQTLSFLQIGGELTYKGTPLCTDSDGQRVPAAGDHLLVTGGHGYWEPDANEIVPSWLFVVDSGNVIPDLKAHPYLIDAEAKPVSALREELGANGATRE
jgi:hypothetical protein